MTTTGAKQLSYKAKYPESWERLSLVNQTAGQLQSLWLGFLSFGAFLAATAVSVTHRDLFLGSPVKLPFLSVELPMLSFFIAAPLLFLLFHFYVLSKYRLLLEALKNFRDLRFPIPDFKLFHPETIEVHFATSLVLRAAAASDQRPTRFTLVLEALLSISLVVMPILILLIIQLKFLAYQHTTTILLHGFILIADIFLSAIFVNNAQNNRPRAGRRLAKVLAIIIVAAISIGPIVYRNDLTREGRNIQAIIASFTRLNPAKRDFVDDKKFELQGKRVDINLSKRNFIGANLEYADLRGIDFRNSDFSHAKMLGAKLDQALLVGANFSFANMKLASLVKAQMNDTILIGTNFSMANMLGANMNRVRLNCANLEGAQLGAAVLRSAQFVGSNLNKAKLLGANLKKANLAGAYLGAATFRGTELKDANFVGAAFTYEDLMQVHTNSEAVKPKNLQYCKIFMQFNMSSIDAPSFKSLIKDSAPIFVGANFDSTKLERTDKTLSTECFRKPPKNPRQQHFYESEECLTPNQKIKLNKNGDLGRVKRLELLWGSKLSNGSNENFQKLIAGLSDSKPKIEEHIKDFNSVNTVCFAGAYPHTAIGVIQAGFLEKKPQISQYILDNRCTEKCLGARGLDPNSLAELWRSARNGNAKINSAIDYGPHELPDVVAKCDFWNEFNNTQPNRTQIDNKKSKLAP